MLKILIITVALFFGSSTIPSNEKKSGCIMLDFDGYTLYVRSVERDSIGPGIMPDTTKQRVLNIVKEHYKYWDVEITESDRVFYSYPFDKRARCIISSDKFVILNIFFFPVDIPAISVYNSIYLKDSTPSVVSIPTLEYSRWIGDAIAHEIGHQLGLAHQSVYIGGILQHEYRGGDSLEAPLMGVPYGSKRSTWTTGTNGFGQYQDDTAIISRTFKRIR